MIGLVGFLRKHEADVDADFLSHFGIDIRKLGTASLPFGRFNALILRLPSDSHTLRSLLPGGKEEVHWSHEMQLQASIVDSLSSTNFLLGAVIMACSNGALKKNPVPEPVPVERPGVQLPKKKRGIAALIETLGPEGRI